MEKRLLNTINEYSGSDFGSLEAALKSHTKRELLDIYLNYEGIIGYTDTILSAMMSLGFDLEIEDDEFFITEDF